MGVPTNTLALSGGGGASLLSTPFPSVARVALRVSRQVFGTSWAEPVTGDLRNWER